MTLTYIKRMTAMDLWKLVRDGNVVEAYCPWCERDQSWWIPNEYRGGDNITSGLRCFDVACGFRVDLPPGPPAILCSQCGGNLQFDVECYRCRCGHEVRPAGTIKTGT